MAFILAGCVLIGTLAISLLMIFAAMMSDAPSDSSGTSVLWTISAGTIISALIAASHWLPHLGW